MRKRVSFLVLALALCLPLLPANASAADVAQFTDVKAGWYYDAAAWASEAGVAT